MPYYVKVTPEVKSQILPDNVKKPKAKDGNYILFQNDLIGIKGNTLQERVNNVGGALLTPAERKAEGDGTVEYPAHCYTPEEYGGEGDGEQEKSESDYAQPMVGVNIPQVIIESDNVKESEVNNE